MNPVVLGVDLGSRNTGFGVLQEEGERFRHLSSGRIRAGSRRPLEARLRQIYDALVGLIQDHQPQALALEEIFLAANVHSAFILGQVRGVVLLAAAQAGVPIFYYPALVVKKAVVGYGQATKAQVQLMVEQLLGVKTDCQHAADALAVGLCHFFHHRGPKI
ncbi:MAG: crossover junction endodeoxyribonuclease RuvC [Deltaproteobacteria bacterium]|nr:crossover junction endodeoxyribonuclease RuvC [Deltaproteobacteria bacterium]